MYSSRSLGFPSQIVGQESLQLLANSGVLEHQLPFMADSVILFGFLMVLNTVLHAMIMRIPSQ